MTANDLVVLLRGRLLDLKPMRQRLRGAGLNAELMRAPGAGNT